ncbi:hypothetical protein MHBO_000442 [Bonamia ostreae]|uniref:GOLD domain-containing protein n=1 Tax=Bonamia ostreae TaxID=126728 RepID=A0ABV2AFN7_9EUKA
MPFDNLICLVLLLVVNIESYVVDVQGTTCFKQQVDFQNKLRLSYRVLNNVENALVITITSPSNEMVFSNSGRREDDIELNGNTEGKHMICFESKTHKLLVINFSVRVDDMNQIISLPKEEQLQNIGKLFFEANKGQFDLMEELSLIMDHQSFLRTRLSYVKKQLRRSRSRILYISVFVYAVLF